MPLLRFNGPDVTPAAIITGLLNQGFPNALTAIDLTPGAGRFWNGSAHVRVTPSQDDFRQLPCVDESYDVAVFDPPHLEDGGRNSVMAKRYGTYKHGALEEAIRAGCREAWRVSKMGVIVKVCDAIHGQRFVRESGWVMDELGEPYEQTHGQHAPLASPHWKDPPLSVRNNASTYLVFKKGDQRHIRRVTPNTGVELAEARSL